MIEAIERPGTLLSRFHHSASPKPALPISATIGDLPMDGLDAILARVEAVGACGVDVVKVGIERAPGAGAVLLALASCGRPVVPVFIADRGLDPGASPRLPRENRGLAPSG